MINLSSRLVFCLIVLSLWNPQVAQAELCAVPVKKIKISSVEKNKNKYEVYPGESFSILEDNRASRQVRIQVGEGEFWIPQKAVKMMEKPACEPDLCVMLSSANVYHMGPQSNQTMSGMSGIFKVVSRYKNWYRFKSDYGFGWLNSSQLKKMRVSCSGEAETVEELLVEVKPIRSEKHEGWKFGLEAGYYPIARSDSMTDVLTPLPSGITNVNSDIFDSPFIEEVNDRFGFFVGGSLETPLFWLLRNQFSLGYKYKVIEYVARPNPNAGVATVTFDQLQREVLDLDFQFVYLTINPKLKGWDFLYLKWQPGFQVTMDVLLNPQTLEFATAPNKTVLRTVDVGYENIEFYYGPRLDIKYRSLIFAAAANFHSTYKMEPELRLGFQF